MADFTAEAHYRVYDESNGRFITIRPDCDGLGLLEIDGGDDYGRITIPHGMGFLLSSYIEECAKDMSLEVARKESEIG